MKAGPILKNKKCMGSSEHQRIARAKTLLSHGAHRAFRRSGIGPRLALLFGGGLVDDGWFRSFREYRPIDRDGRPIPWYTYSFRAFLEPRLGRSMRVFEYGAGLSSLWYAERVAQVVSVEHNHTWAQFVRDQAAHNLDVLLESNEGSYVEAVRNHAPFDIVVIDGLYRRRSAILAAEFGLRDGGVIIWDNSDWQEFSDTFPTLRKYGFRQIQFEGMGPINRQRWETSVLYRPDNCLGI